MVEIHLLEALVAFADCGTLSKAAEKLYTSQPALTRSIKKLENELGVELFNRSKNHMELNKTGEEAVRLARNVLREDEDLEERIHAFDLSLHTIAVAFCAPIPQSVLTPIINDVFNGMSIRSKMSDDTDFLKDLKEEKYDLAVTHYKPDDDAFHFVKCGHEDLYAAVTSTSPLVFYPEIHLKDLNGQTMLLRNHLGFWNNIPHDIIPDTKFLVQIQSSAFEELARNSSYPIFSSSYYVNRNIVYGDRLIIKIADDICHADYYLVCLKKNEKRFKDLYAVINEKTIL